MVFSQYPTLPPRYKQRSFEFDFDERRAYVRPVDRFIPARNAETEGARSANVKSSHVRTKASLAEDDREGLTENCIKCVVS